MSTYLAPASVKQPLPVTPALHLLPFSLGSNQVPLRTSTASTSQYFQPRPCPADVAGIPEGTLIAAFRGRQLVGHSIGIPAGYRGLVITAPQAHQVESKWPLTPAPSIASAPTTEPSATTSTRRSPRKSTLSNVASAIKSKVRGAGQVALAKPKTRLARTGTVKRKRYQIDSEDEDEEERHIEVARETVTPRKRTRAGSAAQTDPVAAEPREDLPVIVVQEATPLKEPLPTPKKRLGAPTVTKTSMPTSAGRKSSESPSPSPSPTPSAPPTETKESQASEGVIPSPATENDPPTFDIESSTPRPPSLDENLIVADSRPVLHTPAPSTDDIKVEVDEMNAEVFTNARVLRPSSTFDSFTLWTPDGPLPGFKQDEGEVEEKDEEAEEAGVKLRKGWWRTGGAGEGGDEIVRALGEWIGLVEELNRPVYLDDQVDSDEE